MTHYTSYLVLRGPWKDGDRVELTLPMHLHAAPMPDKNTMQAVMYGPLIMAARLGEEPRDNWYRHFTADEKQKPAPMMQFTGKVEDPGSWLEPAGAKLTFRTISQTNRATFAPLSSMVHERYGVYHDVVEAT